MKTTEENFWKNILVKMQHENMMHTDGEKLYLQDCQYQFERFSLAHPNIKTEVTDAQSYKVFEFYIAQNLKFRLYIQSQIKASIMSLEHGTFEKVADAKFVNNPFPEIENFIKNMDSYLVSIEHEKIKDEHLSKKQKIAEQFIKAYCKIKIPSNLGWNLESHESSWTLNILDTKKSSVEKNISITALKFKEQIDYLIKSL